MEDEMSVNIPTHYVQQYSSNVMLKLQQMGSRLRGSVMTGSHVGKQASPVDQFGAIAAQRVTGRFNPMGRVDAPTDRRWVFPIDYDLPQLLDSFDKLRLLTDPESSYVTNAVHAMGRAQDEVILDGIFGNNKTGESGGTTTSFDSNQVVGVNQGAASATNLTVAKLKEAKRILMANDVDLNTEQIYAAINATNHDSLLDEIQVISSDFNGGEAVLKEGRIMRFLGINFIHTELLSTGTDDQAGTSTQVPVWVKSGVYMGMWNDITTDISQRKDLQGLPFQAYVYGTFGATRLEEEKVVKIWAR
jgi:hypothetical protein